MIAERALNAWQGVTEAGVKRPITEADYEELHGLMDELTSRQDINEQPWSDLFGLIATYMHEWELVNEPDLKNPVATPHEMLAYLMQQRGVSQYRLAKDGVVSQGTLNAVLKGRRGISKAVAKKLAAYFGVSVELFI